MSDQDDDKHLELIADAMVDIDSNFREAFALIDPERRPPLVENHERFQRSMLRTIIERARGQGANLAAGQTIKRREGLGRPKGSATRLSPKEKLQKGKEIDELRKQVPKPSYTECAGAIGVGDRRTARTYQQSYLASLKCTGNSFRVQRKTKKA